MSLLPSTPDISQDSEPRVVGLDSEEADDLLAALSSETARRILSTLHEEPAPPGELASSVDTSLQNAQYHLKKLEEAGAIEVVGTAYSEKGREMSIYGPADSPLVIYAGDDDRASGLRSAISRLFAGFLALGVGGAIVQTLFGQELLADDDRDATPAAETESTADTETEDEEVGTFETAEEPREEPSPDEVEVADAEPPPSADEEIGAEAADGISALIDGLFTSGMPPGLAFFLGGAIVLTVIVGTTYLRARP